MSFNGLFVFGCIALIESVNHGQNDVTMYSIWTQKGKNSFMGKASHNGLRPLRFSYNNIQERNGH